MSARKSERLMNLLILLLVTRSFLTKDQIRESLEEYRDSGHDAFEKMFERDKEELRSLGIPIETGSHDPLFDDEMGYRITRDAFELPAVDFTADEAQMLGVAARVWQNAGLADTTSQALLKLTAGGADVDRAGIDIAQPALVADEPAFDTVFDAASTRRAITFGYRRSGSAAVAQRHLQPWGMVQAFSRWYVVGYDTDRGEPRVFRLSRFADNTATVASPPGAYDVPRDVDVRGLVTSLDPSSAMTRVAVSM